MRMTRVPPPTRAAVGARPTGARPSTRRWPATGRRCCTRCRPPRPTGASVPCSSFESTRRAPTARTSARSARQCSGAIMTPTPTLDSCRHDRSPCSCGSGCWTPASPSPTTPSNAWSRCVSPESTKERRLMSCSARPIATRPSTSFSASATTTTTSSCSRPPRRVRAPPACVSGCREGSSQSPSAPTGPPATRSTSLPPRQLCSASWRASAAPRRLAAAARRSRHPRPARRVHESRAGRGSSLDPRQACAGAHQRHGGMLIRVLCQGGVWCG
mmetsp:Transcript_41181/g.108798  ORF Transcript_41181/g.108798 Transcript_41181/m.108798 type:complete len:272 (+) Transcript_41181:2-817(+)